MIRRLGRYRLAPFCTISLAALVASRASGSIIWDNIDINGGVSSTAQSLVSQLDNGFGFDAGAADDFFLAPSGHASGDWLVSGVNWAGKFSGSSPVPIPGFNIIFWPNDTGDKPAGGTPSGPRRRCGRPTTRSSAGRRATPSRSRRCTPGSSGRSRRPSCRRCGGTTSGRRRPRY